MTLKVNNSFKVNNKDSETTSVTLVVIVKLGPISHFISVHLLLALDMLLFQLRFCDYFTSTKKQDGHWMSISLMNVKFMSYIREIFIWKYKYKFLGKVRIIIQRYHLKKKRQQGVSYIKDVIDKKNPHSANANFSAKYS